MTNNIPAIGSVGSYELSAPFDKYLIKDEPYICRSLRSLADYLANRDDVLTDVYIANGLTQEDMVSDSRNGVLIAGLQNGPGQWIYVPTNRIARMPDINGIPYRKCSLIVSLPPLKEDEDYNSMKMAISDMILGNFGLGCEVTVVPSSKVIKVDAETHIAATNATIGKINSQHTLAGTIASLTSLADRQAQKIKQLEDYILKSIV